VHPAGPHPARPELTAVLAQSVIGLSNSQPDQNGGQMSDVILYRKHWITTVQEIDRVLKYSCVITRREDKKIIATTDHEVDRDSAIKAAKRLINHNNKVGRDDNRDARSAAN
jgi:hypothetical protein